MHQRIARENVTFTAYVDDVIDDPVKIKDDTTLCYCGDGGDLVV